MKKLITIFLLSAILISCNEEKEDLVNEVPKDGSIETSVSVEHLSDSLDILTTRHIVHKNATTSQTILKTDTIPALEKHLIDDENETKQMVQKDYNIYITVK